MCGQRNLRRLHNQQANRIHINRLARLDLQTQRFLHRVLTFMGRELQQFEIGFIGHFLRMRFQQPIIGHAKIARRKQFFAIFIVLERARFSDERINHMSIVDRGSLAADQTRHSLNENAEVRDLDRIGADLHTHLLTNQPTRHGIAVGSHANRAALGHANARQNIIGV